MERSYAGSSNPAPCPTEHTQTPANDDRSQDNYCAPWESGLVMTRAASTTKQGISPMAAKASRNASRNVKKESQTPQGDTRPLDDYDEPWKSVSLGGGNIPQRPPKPSQTPAVDQRPSDDYDTPWKSLDESGSKSTPATEDYEKPWEAFRPAPKYAGIVPKSQRPMDDSRSLEDYDEPWKSVGENQPQERSVQPIPNNTDNYFEPESIFSAPFSTEPQTVPVCPRARAKLPEPNKKIPLDETKPVVNPIPKPPRLSYFVDPAVPLANQSWYHASVKRTIAEGLLNEAEDCSFLVRDSESNCRDYSLSIKTTTCITHLKIQQDDDGRYVLGQFSQPFDDIPAMIHYYTVNKLNIKGVDHKTLRKPVERYEIPI